MRNTVLAGSVAVALGFLLVTNPVVVEAAGQLTGGDIKNNSLTGKDVKNGSLKSADFGTGQIPAGPPDPPALREPQVRPVRRARPGRSRSRARRPPPSRPMRSASSRSSGLQ